MADSLVSSFTQKPFFTPKTYSELLGSKHYTPDVAIDPIKPFSLDYDSTALTTGTHKQNYPDNPLGAEETSTPLYQNGEALQGYAGLAGALMQAVALPGQLKLAKLQRQGLQQNITQQAVDNKFRESARANLNAPMSSAVMLQGVNKPAPQAQPSNNPAPAMLRRPANNTGI
jgi:hypothetical protein